MNKSFIFCNFVSISFLISTQIGYSAPLDKGTYFYRTQVLESATSCRQIAGELGFKFFSQTKSTFESDTCGPISEVQTGNETIRYYNILIKYDRHSQVYPSISYLGSSTFLDSPTDTMGLYNSLSECKADLFNQANKFKKYTGADVFNINCLPAAKIDSGFVIKIESFASPQARLMSYDLSKHAFGTDDIATKLSSIITSLGGNVVHQNSNLILYYSTTNGVPIKKYQLLYTENQTECEQQTKEALTISNNLGAQESLVRCGTLSNAPKSTFVLELTYGSYSHLSSFKDSNLYFNFLDCQQDKSRALESYKNSGREVLGAICENSDFNSNRVNLRLYERL